MRVIFAVLLAAQVASAQPAQEVTRAFQAGVDAFRLGKHDEARTHLERATKLDPKLPGPHRFLAAVAQAQGRFADCVTSARVAIELNPASQELADTRKVHDDCRRAAGRPGYSQELGDKAAIGVTANVAGATVTISGLVYGATPLEPRPIPAGPHEVELTKTGYLPRKVAVTALAGVVTDVEADLALDPAAEPGSTDGTAKVAPRATGWLELAGDASGRTVVVDGKPVVPEAGRFPLAPGSHVIAVEVRGKDSWRRRVVIAPGQGKTLAPALEDTAHREGIRRLGFPLLVVGGGLAGFGGVALWKGWNGVAVASFGGAAISIGIGIWAYVRGQRPDLTAPPPLALIPIDGGVIASTGLRF